ncbi:MAG: hypothetical protein KTR14_10475 [Vampirovibrio sp.]|nr:hypothetical protein [Vampirovibrio sp.]
MPELTINQDTQSDHCQKALSSQFMQMLTGYWVSQSIMTVVKLNIADELKEQPQDIHMLSKSVGAHQDSLYRLMRMLSSIGIFKESESQVFGLTPLAELLCSDSPNSMKPMVMMLSGENYTAWEHLYEGVKSGESPFEKVFGMEIFQYFNTHPNAQQVFNNAMATLIRSDSTAIINAYNYDQHQTLVDVGGGNGMLLTTLLSHYPSLSGVLFDLPSVINGVTEKLRAEFEDRCHTVSGDFFESVPAGGDCYVLSRVIRGFDDERALKILNNIYKVMPVQGKLLLMEFILELGDDPSTATTKLMDINMMVFAPGGRDRTEEEHQTLLQKAGFELIKVISTENDICILEAIKK